MLTTPMEVELSDEETIAELWKVVESRGKLIESLLSLLADRGFEREARALMGRP